MKKLEQLYEGKAKKVFATDEDGVVIVDYKDDATAFNGEKKGTIMGKGVVNNKMSNYVFGLLEKDGVPTHFIKELSDRETAVKKVSIVPLEVIVRNVAAGSFSKRMGVPEGKELLCPILEFSYKNDELGDPFINDDYALALGLATQDEIDTIKNYTRKVNECLKKYFLSAGMKLIDFKIEFGRLPDGTIILADEISPDTCRLWDVKTNEKLDKDRFRRDLGNVEEAYNEVFRRLYNEAMIRKFVLLFPKDDSFHNLEAALKEQNVKEAFRAAHTLKGVCQNLGFSNLYAPAVTLTETLRAGQLDGTEEQFAEVEKQYRITMAAIQALD